MIRFRARLYDATLESYIDSSPIVYSISTCTNTTKLSQLNMVTDSHTITTIFTLSDFDGGAGTNVAERIIDKAVEIHDSTGEWHELRLFTTDALNDFALVWNHVAPSNLTIIQNGVYSNFEYALPWDTYIGNNDNQHSLAYMFTSASTIEGLNDTALIWMGSYCANNITGNVDTYLSYTEISVTVGNPKYYCYDAGTYFGRNSHAQFYKSNNGSCLIFWRDYPNNGNKGPATISPSVNIHSDITETDTRGAAVPGWDAKFSYNNGNPSFHVLVNNLWWGARLEYASPGNYDSNEWPVFYIQNTSEAWLNMITTVVEESAISVSKRNNELYFYLLGTFGPSEPSSDVDPDDIPPEDEPPIPIDPDNPDPYYDPTSDPDSPQYDPTKDPESPQYDPTNPSTPYRPPTTEGGGDPPTKPPIDPVTPPPTPPPHAINSKFVTLYTPSLSQLNDLADYLWSPAWSVDGFKKILANPMDCILGLMIFPALTASTASKEVHVGNLSTGVTMSYIDNQYVELNCGSLEITEYYASYLDYEPYTKIEIYLPYIGTHMLSADDVMNKTIQLKYMIDLLSGACVAFIVVDGTTLYTFTGSCATPIPVSGNDWSNMVNGILSVAGSAAATVLSGGAATPAVAGAVAATSLFVSSHKERIKHGGSVASAAGLMSIQTPYLIITRPRQALPIGQNSFQGYPSFITESLGSLTGYTEVESCHLEHIPCTAEELEEIERLLKGGVLF